MPKFYKKHLLTPEHMLSEEHKNENTKSEERIYEDDELSPIQDLIIWQAKSRPYRKKDRSFFTTSIVLVVLLSLIAILIDTPFLVLALFAVLFLVVVLNAFPPAEIEYRISTQGVYISDTFYPWDDLESFWFEEKDGESILCIRTFLRYPNILLLVMGPVEQVDLKRVLPHFISFHEIPPKSMLDKMAGSLQKHFPLENPKKS